MRYVRSIINQSILHRLEKKDKNLYENIHNEVDKSIFDYILSFTNENQSEAARILGINRLTPRKKLKY